MPLPVISLAQMREWERLTWASGQTADAVIRSVGQQLADRLRQLTRPGDTLLFLCGKGHNGDDARAAAAALTERRLVQLDILSAENGLQQLEPALAQKPALIVDGLFGIGLNRPLSAGWQQLITAVNESRIPILAVDIPSGLDADTGRTFGACIQASITLTVGAPKIGLLSPDAWPWVGRLEVLPEVGLHSCIPQSDLNWTQPEDFSGFPPARSVAGHKGDFGHAVLLAGSLGYHGAAVLAARGTQRAQPGLITLFTQTEVFIPVAAQLQSVMVQVFQPELRLPEKTSALLIGPGLAAPDLNSSLPALTRRLWEQAPCPVIVDASALDFLMPSTAPITAIRVITPHPGEAARLLQTTAAAIQADRVKALRRLSEKFGNCWVILKGHQTLIGRANGKIFVNGSGNPHLAQGGSGDVLAGYLTGLLAQPALTAEAEKTLCHAVWQHGAAADRLTATRNNWTVEELAVELDNRPRLP